MHWLVVGETGGGKTTYARIVCGQGTVDANKPLRVFDPFREDWPTNEEKPNTKVTDNREEFLKWFWSEMDAVEIVDESAISARRNDEEMIETAILGRHQGHLLVFLCQRVQQVHPTIRGQCSHVVVFPCTSKDAEQLAEEYDEPLLLQAAKLAPGEYLHYHRRHGIVQGKIDFEKQKLLPEKRLK